MRPIPTLAALATALVTATPAPAAPFAWVDDQPLDGVHLRDPATGTSSFLAPPSPLPGTALGERAAVWDPIRERLLYLQSDGTDARAWAVDTATGTFTELATLPDTRILDAAYDPTLDRIVILNDSPVFGTQFITAHGDSFVELDRADFSFLTAAEVLFSPHFGQPLVIDPYTTSADVFRMEYDPFILPVIYNVIPTATVDVGYDIDPDTGELVALSATGEYRFDQTNGDPVGDDPSVSLPDILNGEFIDHAVGGVCGDGFLDTDLGETCDDGNGTPGDGCSDQCADESFDFTVTPGTSGATNTFTVSPVSQGSAAFIVASRQPGTTAVPGCPGLTVPFASPFVLGSAVSTPGTGGVVSTDRLIPAGFSGTATFVAVELDTCRVSPPQTITF